MSVPTRMAHRSGRKATLLLTPVLVLGIAACTSTGAAATAGSSGAPTAGASAAPSVAVDPDRIDHPTGAKDIVLRYDEGGGFIMPAFAATMVPPFTLYGDGTIVFRDPTLDVPPPSGSVITANPLRTARLSEDQIQDILKLALGEGGLAVARPEYNNQTIADAGTAVFTIDAAGIKKVVSVYALGIDASQGPDAAAYAGFQKLAQTLTSIEKGGVITATDYQPAAYRAILMEGMAAPDSQAWPWKDIKPADFAPSADPNGVQFPHRTLTPADVEALGIKNFIGGLQNVPLTGPDGKAYQLSVRPLLPDETE